MCHNILSSIIYTLHLGKDGLTSAESLQRNSGSWSIGETLCLANQITGFPKFIEARAIFVFFPQTAKTLVWTAERLTRPVEVGWKAPKASAEAIPKGKEETGLKGLRSHEEQGLSTNNDSEEETSDWGERFDEVLGVPAELLFLTMCHC